MLKTMSIFYERQAKITAGLFPCMAYTLTASKLSPDYFVFNRQHGSKQRANSSQSTFGDICRGVERELTEDGTECC